MTPSDSKLPWFIVIQDGQPRVRWLALALDVGNLLGAVGNGGHRYPLKCCKVSVEREVWSKIKDTCNGKEEETRHGFMVKG